MAAPFFTTNDSEITRLEGLYIKERNPPATISGAFLGVIGMCGEAVRGPVDKQIEITSEQRFKEVFGGRDQGSSTGAILGKMWLALLNKPFGKVVCVRAAAAGAAASTMTLYGSTFATGTIQEVTKANHVMAETVTIGDGVNTPVVFEYRLDGTAQGGGRIKLDLSNAVTAVDCANILIAAINAQGAAVLNVVATAGAAGLINLTTRTPGTLGNVTITKTVANGGYTVSGMSTGTAGVALCTLAAANVGSWSTNMTAQVKAATDGNAQHWNLVMTYLGKTYIYKNFDIGSSSTADNTLAVLGTDDGNLITLTKVATGVPAVLAATPMAGGTDGSIADSDFTAANRGLNVLNGYKGLGAIFIAERSSSALKSYLVTLASTATDRLYLMCPDNETVQLAAAVTDANTYTRLDRAVYLFNNPYTLDPETATEYVSHPTSWMAAVLSQVDVDIHPGEEDTKKVNAGITRLTYEALQREDYITLKEAGICALERDSGFAFVSGVTMSLTPGREQITRRRMADYLQLSVGKALRYSVKKKSTLTRRKANGGMIDSFLGDLQGQERIVAGYKVDTDILNTDAQRALGVEKILMRVKLISHMLDLVLETEIGTAVSIKEQK